MSKKFDLSQTDVVTSRSFLKDLFLAGCLEGNALTVDVSRSSELLPSETDLNRFAHRIKVVRMGHVLFLTTTYREPIADISLYLSGFKFEGFMTTEKPSNTPVCFCWFRAMPISKMQIRFFF